MDTLQDFLFWVMTRDRSEMIAAMVLAGIIVIGFAAWWDETEWV